MLKSELLEVIANGENSGVEFKRDDLRPEQLAKEIVALLNFQGGKLLLGVEDDGTDLPDFFGPFQSWRTASVASVEQYRCLNSSGVR
ncbi:Divergent AAA domain [Burkholderia pseudomallei]|nr:Divergent AAA domain [Burkholderia pseudomallei]